MLTTVDLPTAIDLLKEIDKFIAKTGMSDTEFGRHAVGNPKFLPRLRDTLRRGTGDIKLARVHQIATYMEARKSEAAK